MSVEEESGVLEEGEEGEETLGWDSQPSCSENPSVDSLRGSLSSDASGSGEEGDQLDQLPGEGKVKYDENIAFTREPRTLYDNIVNALTHYIIQFFVDELKMEKCLASGHDSSDEEDEGGAEEQIGRPSTSQASSVGSSTPAFNRVYNRSEKSRKDSSETVISSDESVEELEHDNYFMKFKGRDRLVKALFKNGNRYEGRISCFMMEGEGLYVWADGTFFKGTFSHGVANGKGYFVWPERGWYYGEIRNNQRDGKGICVAQTASGKEMCYYGRWRHGKRDGKGINFFGKSEWYDGEWKENKMHGYGFRMYKSGSYYEGYWRDGLPHGQGIMNWHQADTYSGTWKNGKMHGRGCYVWRTLKTNAFALPVKNMFDGLWKNGEKHGPGRLLVASGVMIFTIWCNNKKFGPGQIICRNGLKLESSLLFENDKICDVGQPQDIPFWNKWYFEFLKLYQEGICCYQKNRMLGDDMYRGHMYMETSWKAPPGYGSKGRKACLNNIPLLEPVDTMPLWEFIEFASSLSPTKDVEKGMNQMAYEELWLRKVISRRLPELKETYQRYAKLAAPSSLTAPCFLLRLLMWQLCLDSGIDATCFSILSLDRKIGYSAYPLDVVPLFEMTQYLLYLSYETCMRKGRRNPNIPGLCGSSFDYFLTYYILPAAAKDPSQAFVKKLIDWLPLSELYQYYCSFKLPVTIKRILRAYGFDEGDGSQASQTEGSDKIPTREIDPTFATIFLPSKPIGTNIMNVDGSVTFKFQEGLEDPDSCLVDFNILVTAVGDKVKTVLFSTCPKATLVPSKSYYYEVSFLEFAKFVMELLPENEKFGKQLKKPPSKRTVKRAIWDKELGFFD